MEENQKINCTVGSCTYNDCQSNMCTLKQIIVTPTENKHSSNPDESLCSSYRYEQNHKH
jgi:hypothetical protein